MILPENRFPPLIKSGASFFGIMLYKSSISVSPGMARDTQT